MIAITGANLIDGTGGAPLSPATVLVNGHGRIEAVGQQQAVSIPPDCQIIDISGLRLLPGLIDCHDHLTSFGYDLMGRWGRTEPRSTKILRVAKVMEKPYSPGIRQFATADGWMPDSNSPWSRD